MTVATAAVATVVTSTPSYTVRQQKAPVISRPTAQPSISSSKALVNATSAQLVNVTQVS